MGIKARAESAAAMKRPAIVADGGGRVSVPGADHAPAVSRAIAIMRLLADAAEPLSLNVIAKSLGLIPSSCLHILRALVAEEMVAFDPAAKLYALDAGVLTLARGLLRQGDFAQRAQGALDAIAKQFGVTTIAVRLIGLEHMVVIAICRSELKVRLHVDIGSRFPALISATGRCIAAFGGHPKAEIRKAFARLRWDRPPTFKTWSDEVAATKVNGIGIDRGQYIHGITIVATPVFDDAGAVTHCLVAVGLSDQLPSTRGEAIGAALKQASAALSTLRGAITR
jgi:DNA-binding IclR family transcriptional regulator